MPHSRLSIFCLATGAALCVTLAAGRGTAQTGAGTGPAGGQGGGQAPGQPGNQRSMFTRVDENTFTVGRLRIDTKKREVAAPGRVNAAATLEFVANSAGGDRAYESAITIETNPVTFNAALLLIGLDPARARVPTRQFDPVPPQGDPVEVTFQIAGQDRRLPIEELILDSRTRATLQPGPWVYTGSRFEQRGNTRVFLSQVDGVLIGLMHGPQALIDNPRSDAVGGFGFISLNPRLGLKTDTPVTVYVRALDR